MKECQLSCSATSSVAMGDIRIFDMRTWRNEAQNLSAFSAGYILVHYLIYQSA
jgi:hypothetical protein